MVVLDGILGQAMEPVELRFRNPERHAFDWALTGAAGRPARVIKSIDLVPEVLEKRNIALQRKYAEISRQEVRWATERMDDAEYVLVAYGTAARVARSAIEKARARGIKAGLFRPITLWPFPSRELARVARHAHAILTVELSSGQMVEDVRLAVEGRCPVGFHGRMGGLVPTPDEVVGALKALHGKVERTRERDREQQQKRHAGRSEVQSGHHHAAVVLPAERTDRAETGARTGDGAREGAPASTRDGARR